MSYARTRRLAATVAVIALALTACGGETEGSESASGSASASGIAEEGACEGEALAADATGLPADFPLPDGLVLVEAAEAGPSNTADGYFEGDVEVAYASIKAALEEASYRITFDEIERDDAEITYESADGASTGIVELRMRCGTEERVAVHVTNRPA